MFEFQRSENNTLQLAVLRLSGSVPDFPAAYTTPKVRISHINGGAEVEDLAFTNMTQVAGTNRWFYKYSIPANATFTKYLVTYETEFDGSGIASQVTEEFRVVPAPAATTGSGEFSVTLTAKNSVTFQPITSARVRIYDKSNPTVAIAEAFTDSTGKVTFFLNQGLYLVEFKKAGVISEVHDLQVFSNGTHAITGD